MIRSCWFGRIMIGTSERKESNQKMAESKMLKKKTPFKGSRKAKKV